MSTKDERICFLAQQFQAITSSIEESIIGNKEIIQKMVVALIAGGHLLIEGVPGIAKTKIVLKIAESLLLTTQRVQCTPDLLPSDITGMAIFRPDTGKFEIHKGPIFTHILIADEINRTPPKVQSALLEAMAEYQVTLFGSTEPLHTPFFVMATQNPIDQQGTYPLPEAQLDRFMMKLIMKTLGIEEEKKIMMEGERKDCDSSKNRLSAVKDGKSLILEAMDILSSIYIDPAIIHYIAEIVIATRDKKIQERIGLSSTWIQMGASPRASLAFMRSSKALALLDGRSFVTPHDVKSIAHDILRHRISIDFAAEATQGVDSDQIIDKILSHITVP